MNNVNSWHEYIQQLHQHIRQQDEKVKNLEQRIINLENNNGNSHQTTIEKLEYHFDQLKIERLDGTLHIGLTPDELSSNVEDLSLNQSPNMNAQRGLTNQQYPTQQPIKQQIVANLDSYVNEEGPKFLQQLATEYNYPIDQNYQSRILNDIRNQLPKRISYYEEHARNNNIAKSENELASYIYDQVQKEITSSVRQFFENGLQKGE